MNNLPAILGTMIPVIIFLIPIVAILTQHQQKMAQIMRSQNQSPAELDSIKNELQELRRLMHQQTIALDNLNTKVLMPPSQAPVQLEQQGRAYVAE